jgi:serine/threonine protein kinase
MMKKLKPLKEIKSKLQLKSIAEYNTYCLTNIINPLLTQLNSLHQNNKNNIPDPYYHQDIKPANIMFTSDGKATFIDFGLMRSEQNCNLGCGTPMYMSPAYWQGIYGFYKANFINVDKSCMKMGSLSYDNFYKWRSFLSYITNFDELKKKYTPFNKFKRYLLMKNDQYCLGQAIQEMCGACIPKIVDGNIYTNMFNPIYKVSNRLHNEGLNSMAFKVEYKHSSNNYKTLPFYESELKELIKLSSNRGQRGGSLKKTFRVFGKDRNVFKKNGYGNKLFVRIKNKDVPLKDALKFEKDIKYLL